MHYAALRAEALVSQLASVPGDESPDFGEAVWTLFEAREQDRHGLRILAS